MGLHKRIYQLPPILYHRLTLYGVEVEGLRLLRGGVGTHDCLVHDGPCATIFVCHRVG
jgi:hypothetical protein